MKNKRYFLTLTLILISMIGMHSTYVQAGNINANESGVIAAMSGTFEYRGRTYVATDQAIAELYAKLSEDGIDLTAEQAAEAISLAYANIGVGIEMGYLVPITPQTPETEQQTEPQVKQTEPSTEQKEREEPETESEEPETESTDPQEKQTDPVSKTSPKLNDETEEKEQDSKGTADPEKTQKDKKKDFVDHLVERLKKEKTTNTLQNPLENEGESQEKTETQPTQNSTETKTGIQKIIESVVETKAETETEAQRETKKETESQKIEETKTENDIEVQKTTESSAETEIKTQRTTESSEEDETKAYRDTEYLEENETKEQRTAESVQETIVATESILENITEKEEDKDSTEAENTNIDQNSNGDSKTEQMEEAENSQMFAPKESDPSQESDTKIEIDQNLENKENEKIRFQVLIAGLGILILAVIVAIVVFMRKRGDKSGRVLCQEKKLIDIHCHILPGVDDGSRDMKETMDMLEIAQKSGICAIIATPHYIKEQEHMSIEEIRSVFEQVKEAAAQRFPQIQLYLGNEIYYTDDILKDLKEGKALTLAESRYVLIEFSPCVMYIQMLNAVRNLRMAGYLPILAHIERYACLFGKTGEEYIRDLKESGAYFQINGRTLERRGRKQWFCKILKKYGIDFIASDGHNRSHRTPEIRSTAGWMTRKFGRETAEKIFGVNPQKILDSQDRKSEEKGKTEVWK